jgi:hypothetical protein
VLTVPRFTTVLALAAALAAILAVPANAQVRRVDLPALLQTQIDKVHARSHAPVLLPSRMPTDEAQLYPTGGANRRGYDFELASAPDCGGANACFVAMFTAERGGDPFGRRRVRLSNGRRGYFTPLSCGASCSPPQIQWRERGYLYTIQANVGTRATERRELVRMANSAIIRGPR